MARVQEMQERRKSLRLQSYYRSTLPLSTIKDCEEPNESEDSEDLESGGKEKVKERSPSADGPDTSLDVGDNLSPDNGNPDSSSSRGNDAEQGSTAAVADTNNPTVDDQPDNDPGNQADEPPPPNVCLQFVKERIYQNTVVRIIFCCFLFVIAMYWSQYYFGFDNDQPFPLGTTVTKIRVAD